MPTYEKGAVRIHYDDHGSGFPLLIIPGGGLNSTIAGLRESRTTVLCVLALNDGGRASFDRDLARKVAALDVPTFAATPGKLVAAVERALRGETVDDAAL